MSTGEVRAQLETAKERLNDGGSFLADGGEALRKKSGSTVAGMDKITQLSQFFGDLRSWAAGMTGQFQVAEGQYKEGAELVSAAAAGSNNSDALQAQAQAYDLWHRAQADVELMAEIDGDVADVQNTIQQLQKRMLGIAMKLGTVAANIEVEAPYRATTIDIIDAYKQQL